MNEHVNKSKKLIYSTKFSEPKCNRKFVQLDAIPYYLTNGNGHNLFNDFCGATLTRKFNLHLPH